MTTRNFRTSRNPRPEYVIGLAFGAVLFGGCGAEFMVEFDEFPEVDSQTSTSHLEPGHSFFPLSAFLDIDDPRSSPSSTDTKWTPGAYGPDTHSAGEQMDGDEIAPVRRTISTMN